MPEGDDFNDLCGWFAENRQEATLFDTWQASITDASAKVVAAAYDFSTARSVVDVGSLRGDPIGVLAFVVERPPHSREAVPIG